MIVFAKTPEHIVAIGWALAGLFGLAGLLTWEYRATFASFVRWKLPAVSSEQFSQGIDEKRALIAKAREFVVIATGEKGINTDFKRKLESYAPYFELRPHLSVEFRKKVDAQRTVFVPRDGTHLPALASWFLDELDRLEKEWGLRF